MRDPDPVRLTRLGAAGMPGLRKLDVDFHRPGRPSEEQLRAIAAFGPTLSELRLEAHQWPNEPRADTALRGFAHVQKLVLDELSADTLPPGLVHLSLTRLCGGSFPDGRPHYPPAVLAAAIPNLESLSLMTQPWDPALCDVLRLGTRLRSLRVWAPPDVLDAVLALPPLDDLALRIWPGTADWARLDRLRPRILDLEGAGLDEGTLLRLGGLLSEVETLRLGTDDRPHLNKGFAGFVRALPRLRALTLYGYTLGTEAVSAIADSGITALRLFHPTPLAPGLEAALQGAERKVNVEKHHTRWRDTLADDAEGTVAVWLGVSYDAENEEIGRFDHDFAESGGQGASTLRGTFEGFSYAESWAEAAVAAAEAIGAPPLSGAFALYDHRFSAKPGPYGPGGGWFLGNFPYTRHD